MFIYKWLPIIFGCHCKKERSFRFHKKQFPICARCTGELIGIVVGSMGFIFYHPAIHITLLLMIPMVIDGFIQLWTSYRSKNWLRCSTGILFGYALITIFVISAIYMYEYGYAYGLSFYTT